MKVSISEPTNAYCPQTFYTYGTYKEGGSPNFGLFCWLSYCWDGELSVMACIGGEKLTKDRIRANGIFSANLVSEELLPLANYFGNTEGYNPDKMKIDAAISNGKVLDVPVLDLSPWVYELEVKKTIKLDDSDIFICKIRNTLVDKQFTGIRRDDPGPMHLNEAKPVVGWGGGTYFKVGEIIPSESLSLDQKPVR
jgi:flavin reductase (DIM6/NTAB) family NADH-FMN oxidoreductase RutF